MIGTDMHKDIINKFLDDIESAIWDIVTEDGDVSYKDKVVAINRIIALRKYIKEV